MSHLRSLKRRLKNQGFTFIEVMVALVIFSSGIVAIFHSFLFSLDRIDHLMNRLYATTLLDQKVASIQKNLTVYRTLPMDFKTSYRVSLGGKEQAFYQNMKIKQIENFIDIFELTLTYTWQEHGHTKQMTRSRYLADFKDEQ